MTQGPAPRTLITTLASADTSILDLLPDLRAALNGSGPALLLHGPNQPAAGVPGSERPLIGPADDPQDPTAVAVTTSGSGGAARTVLLPASALLASAAATHDRLGGAGHWLLALPAQHVAGLQVLVRSLIAGTRPVALDLTAGFSAEGFTEAALALRGARRYTALVPTQLTRLLSTPGEAGVRALEALRRFDAVLIGGAATPLSLRERAAAAGIRVVTTYGMSETAGGCVYDGVPLDGVTVQIPPRDHAPLALTTDPNVQDHDPSSPRDHARLATPDSASGGRIWLGGPMLARGYLDAPGDPAFSVDPGGNRWFRTDDAGVLDNGQLRILGRLDSMIITGGVNVSPGSVEAVLHRLPEVAEAVVVGLPDPQWGQRVAVALVLAPGARPPTLAQVRALVTAEVSGPAAPRQLTVLGALPLRGPGKPDRIAIERALREQPPLEGI